MNIILCGKEERVEGLKTINDLLRHLRIQEAETGFAVAVNQEIVFRSTWAVAELNDGDRVEIVRATQGG